MRRWLRAKGTLPIAAGFGSQAVVLVSGVVVARTLGVEDRGNLALLALAPTVLAAVGTLGIPLAATYFIARQRSEAGAIARSLVRPSLLQCALLLPLQAVLLLVLLEREPEVVRAGILSLAVTPALIGTVYGLAILQGLGDFRRFYAWGLSGPVLYTSGVLLLVLGGVADLFVVTLVFVVSQAVAALGTLMAVTRVLPPPTDAEQPPAITSLLRFGIKAVPGAASPLEYFRVDQALVALFLSPVSMGLYVSALAFTNLPRFVANNIGQLAYPQVAAEHERPRQRQLVWRFTGGTVVVTGAIVLVLEVLAADLLRLFFGPEFVPAAEAMRVLLLAALLLCARRVLSDAARGAGLPGAGTVAEAVSWLAFLVSLVLLDPREGIVEIAWALTIGFAAALVALVAIVLYRGRNWSSRGLASDRHDLAAPAQD